MSDLISRQAAIELKSEFLNPNVNRETEEQTAIDRAYARGWNSCNTHWIKEIIEDLPSAQPEQRWIPCSERLPEKDGRYQVTRYDYVANTEFIDILWYEENLWWNRHSTGDYAVTAWMPLPEPYKEEQE